MALSWVHHLGETYFGLLGKTKSEYVDGWKHPDSAKPARRVHYDLDHSDWEDSSVYYFHENGVCFLDSIRAGDIRDSWSGIYSLNWQVFRANDGKLYYVSVGPIDLGSMKDLVSLGWTKNRRITLDGIQFDTRIMTEEEYREFIVKAPGDWANKPWDEDVLRGTNTNQGVSNAWSNWEEMVGYWGNYYAFKGGGTLVMKSLDDPYYMRDGEQKALVLGTYAGHRASIASASYWEPSKMSVSWWDGTMIRPVLIRDVPIGKISFKNTEKIPELVTDYRSDLVKVDIEHFHRRGTYKFYIDSDQYASGSLPDLPQTPMPQGYSPTKNPNMLTGQTDTVSWQLPESVWNKLSLGQHIFRVEVWDTLQGNNSASFSFTKAIGEPTLVNSTPGNEKVLNSDTLDIHVSVDDQSRGFQPGEGEIITTNAYMKKVQVQIYDRYNKLVATKSKTGVWKPNGIGITDINFPVDIGADGLNLARDSRYSYRVFVTNNWDLTSTTILPDKTFYRAQRQPEPKIITPTGTPTKPMALVANNMVIEFTADDPIKDVDTGLRYAIFDNDSGLQVIQNDVLVSKPNSIDYRVSKYKYRISTGLDKCVQGKLYRLCIYYLTAASEHIPDTTENGYMQFSEASSYIYFTRGNPPADGPIIECPVSNYRMPKGPSQYILRPLRQQDDHPQHLKGVFTYWQFNEKTQAYDIKGKEEVIESIKNPSAWEYTTTDGQWASYPSEGVVFNGTQLVRTTQELQDSDGYRIQLQVYSYDAVSEHFGKSNAVYFMGSASAEVTLEKAIEEETRFKEIYIISSVNTSKDAYGATKYSKNKVTKAAISNFKEKIVGSSINPNVAKMSTGAEMKELDEQQYNALNKIGAKYFEYKATGEKTAKSLHLEYHLIDAIEKTTGELPYASVDEKVNWLVANVEEIHFDVVTAGLASDVYEVSVIGYNTNTAKYIKLASFPHASLEPQQRTVIIKPEHIASAIDHETGVLKVVVSTKENENMWDGQFDAGQISSGSDKEQLEVIPGEDGRTTKWIKCIPEQQYRILDSDMHRWQYKDAEGTIHWLVDAQEVLIPKNATAMRVTYTNKGKKDATILGTQVLRVADPKCTISYFVGHPMKITCEVTNNGLDEKPKWEDATTAYLKGMPYEFMNNDKTAEHWGLNFRFVVTANDTVGELQVSSIGLMYR